jgi:hypothetical protein
MEIMALPWKSMMARDFENRGLLLVQDSGPKNALGTIKFELDNHFDIYMHDTNRRDLFSKAIRLESSGCMRLESPSDLAYYLLKGRPEYSTVDAIQNQLMTGDPIHDAELKKDFFIHLAPEEKLTVYTAFLTADATEDGKLRLAKDWYGIDARIKELNAPKPQASQLITTTPAASIGSNNTSVPATTISDEVSAVGNLVVNGEAGPGQLFRKVLAVRCSPTNKYSCEKNIYQGNLNEPISLPVGEYLVGFENSIYPGWVTIDSGTLNILTLEKLKIPANMAQEQSLSIAKDYSKNIELLKLGSQLFYIGKYLFASGPYSSFEDFYLVNSQQADYLSRIDYGVCVENGALAKDVQTKGMKLTALCSDWLKSNTVSELLSFSSVLDQVSKGGVIGQRYIHKGSFNSPFYIPFANKPHLVSAPIRGDQFVSVFPGSYLIYKTGKSNTGKSVDTDHISTDSFVPFELMIPDFTLFNQNITPPSDVGI